MGQDRVTAILSEAHRLVTKEYPREQTPYQTPTMWPANRKNEIKLVK